MEGLGSKVEGLEFRANWVVSLKTPKIGHEEVLLYNHRGNSIVPKYHLVEGL